MPLLHEEDIFRLATKIDTQAHRELYLEQVCGDDIAMRQRLQILLAADEDDSKLLPRTTPTDASESQTVAESWEEIEAEGFEIIRKLGEGGMG
ncbi:MAG: hypothetical protein ACPGLY_28090, partial [Rubripirellula sp.]